MWERDTVLMARGADPAEKFARIEQAFAALSALKLRKFTDPEGATTWLDAVVRGDSWAGERVMVAAERYVRGVGDWASVTAAFAEWVQPLLADYTDTPREEVAA